MSASYEAAFAESIANREAFWLRAAEAIDWAVAPTRAYAEDAGWFAGASLNTCHNCLDRHVDAGRGETTALIYDSPATGQHRLSMVHKTSNGTLGECQDGDDPSALVKSGSLRLL